MACFEGASTTQAVPKFAHQKEDSEARAMHCVESGTCSVERSPRASRPLLQRRGVLRYSPIHDSRHFSAHERALERYVVGILVSRAAQRTGAAAPAGARDAAGRAAGAGPRSRRKTVRAARRVSAPRVSAFLRAI